MAAGCLNISSVARPEFAAAAAGSLSPPASPSAASVGFDSAMRMRARRVSLSTPRMRDDYAVDRSKSVLDLQQFRESTELPRAAFPSRAAAASLTDLNPAIGTWYVLRLTTPDGASASYHLENPSAARLRLDAAQPAGIVMEAAGADAAATFLCELWPTGTPTDLLQARESHLAYAPLCGGRLFLRNPVEGHRSRKEQVVELLRDNVWQGEEITAMVKDLFFRDAFRATSALAATTAKRRDEPASGPADPRVSGDAAGRSLDPIHLELGIEGADDGRMVVGRWYPAQGNPGMFVTTLRPDVVAPEIVAEQKGRVSVLDPLESESLAYLVAFDLAQFDLGFEVGTDHPRVGWSEMVQPAVRDDALAGPDGIDTLEPLVRTGMLSPGEAGRVAATFTGGFKRSHGAFKMSDLALIDHGTHYGFIENGVVMSKLQPGLATVLVFDDGRVDLRTWSRADDVELPRIRHARQNGVPILEPEGGSGRVVPGARVRQWGPGNWSGSADKNLRTVRGGLCLQEREGRQFLLYGYFSSATPSAMARVFEATGCSYAMLLDMNALEHTYMAAYHREGGKLVTQHLIDGMDAVDGSRDGELLPRFVSVADNRDFFYLLRRTPR
jgi:hypothetical protein